MAVEATESGSPRSGLERAVLVAVELGGRTAGNRTAQAGARQAAVRADALSSDEAESEFAAGSDPDPAPATPETALPFSPASTGPGPQTGLDTEESLAEFRELVASAGGEVVAEVLQRRPRPDPATLIGSRTQLILDIFARHARTSEGQLQVELAQLEYMLPRLTGKGKAMSQLGGGIGTRGPGETKLETDRRRIQRRIDQLKQDLDAVRRVRKQQRQRRESVPVPTVALVGYTNAGKSTLFNRLTGAQVLQSSRMFATLDPKLRAIELPSRRKVLLSDTVGFIRNLPHTLVTSFRATLEEVAQAEVLLHVRDASSTYGEEQKSQVEKVLGELEALGKPRIEVLNKIDLVGEHERAGFLARSHSGGEIAVSARTGEGMEALLKALDAALYSDPVIEAELRVPQQEGSALAAIEAGMVVHSREYEGNLVRLKVSGPASLIGRLRKFRLRDV
jgi:GTP-binding protein HflX